MFDPNENNQNFMFPCDNKTRIYLRLDLRVYKWSKLLKEFSLFD